MRYQPKRSIVFSFSKLSHFLHVADHGSFTKAAAVLQIAQSALSRQICDLEEEFGGRLFHRTGRGVVPTEFAFQILPRVRALLIQAEQLADDIGDAQGAQGAPKGQVRLAMLASLGGLLLTPLLSRISDRFPGIQVHVLEGLADHVEEWLAVGRVDLGILYGRQQAHFRGDELLMTAQLYLVAKQGCPIAVKPTTHLREITGLPMILPALPNRWRQSIESACAAHKVPLSVTFELDSIQTIKDLIACGGRYSILPLHAIQREVKQAVLQASRLVDPAITRSVYLSSTMQRPRSRASNEVAKMIRELVKEMIASGLLPGTVEPGGSE